MSSTSIRNLKLSSLCWYLTAVQSLKRVLYKSDSLSNAIIYSQLPVLLHLELSTSLCLQVFFRELSYALDSKLAFVYGCYCLLGLTRLQGALLSFVRRALSNFTYTPLYKMPLWMPSYVASYYSVHSMRISLSNARKRFITELWYHALERFSGGWDSGIRVSRVCLHWNGATFHSRFFLQWNQKRSNNRTIVHFNGCNGCNIIECHARCLWHQFGHQPTWGWARSISGLP